MAIEMKKSPYLDKRRAMGIIMSEKALSSLSPTGSCRIGVWEVEIVGFPQDFALNFVRGIAG